MPFCAGRRLELHRAFGLCRVGPAMDPAMVDWPLSDSTVPMATKIVQDNPGK